MNVYVVRRAFKAHGVVYEVGDIITDPKAIKLFRSRVNGRDILELLVGDIENNLNWLSYLETRVRGPIDKRILDICGIVEVPKEVKKVVKPVPVAKPVVATK